MSNSSDSSGSDSTKIWGILALIGLVVVLAVSFVLSGSKRTMNADDVRKGDHPRGDKVAFLPSNTNVERLPAGSVVCAKDHTHGYPVCGTCKKVMNSLANGLFICPECGRVGLPICPVCGDLMQPVEVQTTGSAGGMAK